MSKALRESGIGVAEMANYLGVSRDTIGRWTNGRGEPKRAAVVAWAAITNVDLDWLETGNGWAPRVSNPEPAVSKHFGLELVHSVKRPLTANRAADLGRTLTLVVAS